MGEATGFLKWERALPTRRPVPVRLRDWKEVYEDFPAEAAADPGRALHGLRHPVLQQRLPARQPDPRLERPRLPRPLARRDRPAARHQQLPRVHRPAVPGAVRGGVRARHQRRPGDDQAGRGRDHRPGVGRGLGHARRSRRSRPASGSPSSAPGRPGSPPPSSSPGPATTSSCSSGPTASAACCATASPSSRWRSATSTGASSRWRPRAPSSAPTPRSATASTSTSCWPPTTPSCSPAARRRGATCRSPGRELRRDPPGDGVPAVVEPGAGGRPRRAADHRRRQARRDHRRRRHRRRLPRHRRTARARRRSPSSRSCPGRPTTGPPTTRGRSGA